MSASSTSPPPIPTPGPELPATSSMRRSRPRHPALMLGAAVVLLVLTGPGQTVGVSVFVDHFITDLNLTRSQVSTAYLLGTLSGAFAMPLAGRFIDRRGLRIAGTVIVIGFVAVLFGMAAVTGFVTLALGFAGTRGFGQGALTLTATTTVAVWFDKRRGTAVGLLSALGGAGMAMVPIFGAVLIAAFGWRGAWMTLAAATAAIGLPVAWWVVRDPRSTGDARATTTSNPLIEPVSDPVIGLGPAGSAVGDRDDSVAQPSIPGWTPQQVLRDRAFWVVVSATSAAGMLGTALVFHQIDLLGERGLDATAAAANFVPQTLAAAGGALLAGRLADRVPPRFVLAAALVLLGLPNLWWFVVSPGVTAVAYGMMIGLASGSIRTVEGAALPRWYGISSIGEIRGFVMGANVGATAIGPIALSVGRDLTGGYATPLVVLTVIPAVLALFAATLRPPSPDGPSPRR